MNTTTISRVFRIGFLVAMACVLAMAQGGGGHAARTDPPRDQDAFFGLDKIWDVHLTVARESWRAMYPTGSMRMGLSQRGAYPYVKAQVKVAGHDLAEVGLRFKGNSTFWTTHGTLKRPFKLDFNRHDPKQNFLGLGKLNLQNNATDSSQLRESVSYEGYRACGVPASRCCFARVYLTIPDQFDKEYLGLYTVVEQVDRRFLERHFDGKSGLLMKPEGRVLPYHGAEWSERYVSSYTPKTTFDPALTASVIGFAKAVAELEGDDLKAAINQHLDLDAFLRYVAVTTILVNLDSPLSLAHNYYLAVPESVGRVVWLPWDLNLSLGGFGGGQTDLSIMRPSRTKVFTKTLAVPEFAERYKKIVRECVEGGCSAKSLAVHLAKARKTVTAAIEQEKTRSEAVKNYQDDPGGRGLFRGFSLTRRGASIEDFLKRREESVVAQLDGKSEGRASGGMFGGFGRRTNRGDANLRRLVVRSGVVDLEGSPTLTSDEVQQALTTCFSKLDTDQSGGLKAAEIETEVRRQLKTRGVKIGSFDLAGSRAKKVFARLDGDGDGSVNAKEWLSAYSTETPKWDANKDGKWTAGELEPRR